MLMQHSKPELRTPALLCGFAGWADAASAASGALRYLLLKRRSRRVASFDPDSIYVYTQTRPLTLRDSAQQRRVEWPALDISAIETPESARDLLLMVGSEPDLRWQECAREILDLAEQMQVSAVITFGAFLAQVHFAGPPMMMGVSPDARFRSMMRRRGLADSNYQGPTGFNTILLREAADRGIPAASLWVAAPSYLGATSNPKLSAALLGEAEQLLGQQLWKEELDAAGRHMETRILEALQNRPDLVDLLKRLEGGTAADEPDDLAVDSPESSTESTAVEELPSPEEVLKDLEEHLRRLKEEGNSGSAEGD